MAGPLSNIGDVIGEGSTFEKAILLFMQNSWINAAVSLIAVAILAYSSLSISAMHVSQTCKLTICVTTLAVRTW